MEVKLDEKKRELTITLPLSERTSRSGKTLVIATTGGNQPTNQTYKGKVVYVGVNAYVRKGD